jgi:hypothetical protein
VFFPSSLRGSFCVYFIVFIYTLPQNHSFCFLVVEAVVFVSVLYCVYLHPALVTIVFFIVV